MPRQSGHPCANCGKRPGTVRWGDSLMMSHGLATKWCRLCVLEAQVAHASERAKILPSLKAALTAERKRLGNG